MHDTLVVTTSRKADRPTIARARSSAKDWDLPFVDRAEQTLGSIVGADGAALVFTNSEVSLATVSGILTFHLGTAFIRILGLVRGEPDPLVRSAALQSGDSVLDTTFGLGRDALVASFAVGPSGRVVGIESSVALYHLATTGLERSPTSIPGIEDAARSPVTLVLDDSLDYLEATARNSFDVVLIDPMFETPKTSDPGFAQLRQVCDDTALSRRWIQEARRVARRSVILKVGQSQDWFGEEGLEWVPSNGKASWYRAPANTGLGPHP